MRTFVVLGLALLLAGCAGQRGAAPVVDRTARGAPATPAPAPRPGAAQAPAPAPVEAGGTYSVKRGDTLYSIALENGADYREVAAWNALDDPAKIRVGQVLRVKPDESHGVTVSRPSSWTATRRGADLLGANSMSGQARPLLRNAIRKQSHLAMTKE